MNKPKIKWIDVPGVPPGPETNATDGQVKGLMMFGEAPNRAPEAGALPKTKHEIVDDRAAIRAALKESRKQHTTKVRTHKLP